MIDRINLFALAIYPQVQSRANKAKQLALDNQTVMQALRGQSVAVRPAAGERLSRTDSSGKCT